MNNSVFFENLFYYFINDRSFFALSRNAIDKKLFENQDENSVIYLKIWNTLFDWYDKYSDVPNITDLNIFFELNEKTEQSYKNIVQFLTKISNPEIQHPNIESFKDQVDNWIKIENMRLAIIDSADILDSQKLDKQSYSDILVKVQDALGAGFEKSVGHDYYEKFHERLDYYTSEFTVIPTYLETLDNALSGGLVTKSLISFVAPTNVGKTMWLSHLAESMSLKGHDILYLTGEISNEEVSKRIDANLLDTPTTTFSKGLNKSVLTQQFKNKVKQHKHGTLIIEEFEAGKFNAIDLENLLQQLDLQKQFCPKIIFIDYLNLMHSTRLTSKTAGTNPYAYIKHIAEEVRNIAVKKDVVIVTPTQLNRESTKKSNEDKSHEVDETGVSESWGFVATVDWMGIIMNMKEFSDRQMLKVVKTRFGTNKDQTYIVGVDKSKQRLFDVKQGLSIKEREEKKLLDQKFNGLKPTNGINKPDENIERAIEQLIEPEENTFFQ